MHMADMHMADMLNSSRDTLLELKQLFALVLKLAVATVLTAAAVSGKFGRGRG